MSKLQVLVTTMYATDFSKYYEMNLKTDSVIANQADENSTLNKTINGNSVKLVTTSTRGTSKNRNIALLNINPNAQYIMFSDDDLRFYDNYEEIILKAFEENPQADAIKFNLNLVSQRKISMNPIRKYHRVNRREVTSWGVLGLAIRTNVIEKHKITFNERFGPGTENYCGEDTIFLQELFKKKVKIFASPEYIADIDQSDSSWFEGYTEKYFNVSGMVLSEIYPFLCYPIIVRSAYKFSKRKQCDFKFLSILKFYYCGVRENAKQNRNFRQKQSFKRKVRN